MRYPLAIKGRGISMFGLDLELEIILVLGISIVSSLFRLFYCLVVETRGYPSLLSLVPISLQA